jgi:hypothetical protein
MKLTHWSKKILAFVLGAITMSVLSFIVTSNAQNPFVKLVMRFGEERVLEDGTKVVVSKGDGDLIIVTLSRPTSNQGVGFNLADVRPKPERTSRSATALEIGTYKIVATETVNINGVPFKETGTFSIKIESVDASGAVKAHLYKGGGEGRLKGQVGSNGQLQLEGVYFNRFNQEWRIKLNATVEDDTLIDGNYVDASSHTESRGTFNIGTLQK